MSPILAGVSDELRSSPHAGNSTILMDEVLTIILLNKTELRKFLMTQELRYSAS